MICIPCIVTTVYRKIVAFMKPYSLIFFVLEYRKYKYYSYIRLYNELGKNLF